MTTVVYDTKNRILYTDCRTTHSRHVSDASNKVIDLSDQNIQDPKLGRLLCLTGAGNVARLTACFRDILEHGPSEYHRICGRYESIHRDTGSTALVIGEKGHMWFGAMKSAGKYIEGTGSGFAVGRLYLQLAVKEVITMEEAMLVIGAADGGSSINFITHALSADRLSLTETHHTVTNVTKTKRRIKAVMGRIADALCDSVKPTVHDPVDRRATLLSAVAQ